MKRILSVLIVLAVFVTAAPSFACPVLNKARQGLKDIITAPAAVSDNMTAETKDAKFFPFAFVGGFAKGLFYMAKQIVTGTLDIVTSPLQAIKKTEAPAKS